MEDGKASAQQAGDDTGDDTGDDKNLKPGDDAGSGDDVENDADDGGDDKLSSGKLDVEELLDEYGLDSADDLKEFISGLSEMKGKIGDNDLDTLLENTKTLQKYQENWQQQEEEKRRENETPEQTIARLEKEKKDLKKANLSQAERQRAAKEAERALDDFTDTVSTVIKGTKDLPKEYRPFVAKFMGVDNPINEVDITDKAKVRRLTKEAISKDVSKFEQAVIKRYLAGKVKIPKVSSTEPTGPAGDEGKSKVKNLKDAKRIMMESVGAFAKK